MSEKKTNNNENVENAEKKNNQIYEMENSERNETPVLKSRKYVNVKDKTNHIDLTIYNELDDFAAEVLDSDNFLKYVNARREYLFEPEEAIKKYFGESYKIHTDKMDTNGFYCSQYIWYVYYITAKELGIELDIDSDGGIFVFPYDFINSPSLEIVK